MKKFSEWLRKEINNRNWTQAELAERSSVPSATISRIINNTRDPGPEIANKLAKALNYPPELLFRKAGLLPETKEYAINPALDEANQLLNELPKEYQKQALQLIRFLHDTHVPYNAKKAKSSPG